MKWLDRKLEFWKDFLVVELGNEFSNRLRYYFPKPVNPNHWTQPFQKGSNQIDLIKRELPVREIVIGLHDKFRLQDDEAFERQFRRVDKLAPKSLKHIEIDKICPKKKINRT
jgi:hypothetical protein